MEKPTTPKKEYIIGFSTIETACGTMVLTDIEDENRMSRSYTDLRNDCYTYGNGKAYYWEMKNVRILSWLPSQDNDANYPEKEVVILTQGKKGYHTTDWKMSREAVIKRNKVQGFMEVDREKADHFACFGYDMQKIND